MMTSHTYGNHDRQLDAYLDGVLPSRERTAFVQLLSREPRLRAEVERQGMIDDALTRLFMPPSHVQGALERLTTLGDSAQLAASDAPSAKKQRWSPKARLAIAAAVALGTVSVWLNRDLLLPTGGVDPYAPQPWRSPAVAYRFEVDRGFSPDWVCETDRQFRAAFQRRFSRPLLLGELPEGLAALGLAYRNVITPRTVVLLARVRETDVLVLVDRADADSGQSVTPASDLYLHRRLLGGLVLYELSPLDEPHLLRHFFVPQPP